MAGGTKAVIRALLGCKTPQAEVCGELSKKIANYRGYQNLRCTPAFGTMVNSSSLGVQKYGDATPAAGGGCCEDTCGSAAGKIPVQNGLGNLPSRTPAPTSKPSAPTSSGQRTWLGTAPQTFGGGQLGGV